MLRGFPHCRQIGDFGGFAGSAHSLVLIAILTNKSRFAGILVFLFSTNDV